MTLRCRLYSRRSVLNTRGCDTGCMLDEVNKAHRGCYINRKLDLAHIGRDVGCVINDGVFAHFSGYVDCLLDDIG